MRKFPNKKEKGLHPSLTNGWNRCDIVIFQKNNLQPYFTSIHGCRPGARVVCWGGGEHRKFWWDNSRMKTKKKVFIANASPWRRSCCFLFGYDFCFGGIKTSFDANFALTFGGKTKKKNKSLFWKCTPVASVLLLSFWARFLLGDTFSLGGTKTSFGTDFASHLGVKTKNKTKRSWSQMHPNGVGLVAFFWGTILARLRGAIVLAWGSRPRNDPRGTRLAWISQ